MRIGIIVSDPNGWGKVDNKSIIFRIADCLKNASVSKLYIVGAVNNNLNINSYLGEKFSDSDEIVIIKGNCFIFDKLEINRLWDKFNCNLMFVKGKNICFIKGEKFNKSYIEDIFLKKENECKNNDLIMEIGNNVELLEVNKLYYKYICEKLINEGVKIYNIDATYISEDVTVGKNVEIYPNNYILANSVIGDNSVILPNCYIDNSFIGDYCSIGPFSHIKNNCKIGDNCVVGAYVEVKNSILKEGVKAKHHAYLGDVDIEEATNIGCGVIIANYNGKNKYRSKIGNNGFIGSNVTIVSPVNIGNNVVIAAGSVIVNDVNDYSLAIARERQINKDGYYL